LSIDGDKVAGAEEIKMGKRIREVAQAPDGSVLLLTDGDDGEPCALPPLASLKRAFRRTPRGPVESES
jgi:hypothetical protein